MLGFGAISEFAISDVLAILGRGAQILEIRIGQPVAIRGF